ncbi:MAG: ABC transporter permease [Limnochordia bacterium]
MKKTAGFILLFYLLVGLFAPYIAPYEPHARPSLPFQKPSREHLLGTNDLGNDIFSELVYGTRVSLLVGGLTGLLAVTFGLFFGVLGGYWSGWAETIILRLIDFCMVIPFIPLLILLSVYLKPGYGKMILIMSALFWAPTARILRSQILSLKQRPFVEAALCLGASPLYILRHYLLPHLWPLCWAQLVYQASRAILLEASLSFLGLGNPLQKSWGTILYYAQARHAFLTDAWLWWILPPGLLTAGLVIAMNLYGSNLEAGIDPRRKGSA